MTLGVLRQISWLLCGSCLLLATSKLAAQTPSVNDTRPSNPIAKLARLIDPKLAKAEDRLLWLDSQTTTLARYHQFLLKYDIGYRGYRESPESLDPAIVLDFGKTKEISSIYLVPLQSEFPDNGGIFPKRFTITVSDDPEFKESTLIYRSGKHIHRQETGAPMKINARHTGRYLRLSVQEGHLKDRLDLFGLSEIAVFSGQTPISLGCKVSASNSLETKGIYSTQTLVDGRTPLGIWHHGKERPEMIGDLLKVADGAPNTSWLASIQNDHPIDQLILFPYTVELSDTASLLPNAITVEIQHEGENTWKPVHKWQNPLPNSTRWTPLVIPLNGLQADKIRIVASQPWLEGDEKIVALSEIEVWSGGENIILNQPITRTHNGETSEIASLTDGFSSVKSIMPMELWLKQLNARQRIKAERDYMNSVYRKLSEKSELNVSWGSAVLLGLTFLIPVYLFERRRMQSREHIDEIRKRIASDLHDDIGSNLGSISLIARTARKDLARLQGPLEIDGDLGEVETIARESSLAMRDIVWLLERKQDSIGDLVHRMRETAGRLMREVKFNLECDSSNTGAKLSLDAKRHLFLFYKEAVHNIIKHSKASHVTVRLWDQGDKLGMEIKDNGVGLPISMDGEKTHVKKLEDRAKVLHGSMKVTSSPETGTRIGLLVRRSHLTTHPNKSA